ncbi:hypothetical protein M427DRAFT_59586 [Gonapodya prolifera JEL478]|uniref:Uncharacterized protein n=1 Tax=Gonapodya prolifera (strain JEL478) TaxID=1344416 RepID=A0A139A7U4_GONPJ|nr:hypothetical protein M427DRAFT_59586 [Gonapodya prolifera JEL478]|eukprot:KXS12443.1 hypothetical protein M427DRAFT_59586 [Gonapodya prolifera JEL478]
MPTVPGAADVDALLQKYEQGFYIPFEKLIAPAARWSELLRGKKGAVPKDRPSFALYEAVALDLDLRVVVDFTRNPVETIENSERIVICGYVRAPLRVAELPEPDPPDGWNPTKLKAITGERYKKYQKNAKWISPTVPSALPVCIRLTEISTTRTDPIPATKMKVQIWFTAGEEAWLLVESAHRAAEKSFRDIEVAASLSAHIYFARLKLAKTHPDGIAPWDVVLVEAERLYLASRTEPETADPDSLLVKTQARSFRRFVAWDLENLGCFASNPQTVKNGVDVSKLGFLNALDDLTYNDFDLPLDAESLARRRDRRKRGLLTAQNVGRKDDPIPIVDTAPAPQVPSSVWTDAHLFRNPLEVEVEGSTRTPILVPQVALGTTWRCPVPDCSRSWLVNRQSTVLPTIFLVDQHIREHLPTLLNQWSHQRSKGDDEARAGISNSFSLVSYPCKYVL